MQSRALLYGFSPGSCHGVNPSKLEAAVERVLSQEMPSGERIPAQWDGHAGERIIADLVTWLGDRKA